MPEGACLAPWPFNKQGLLINGVACRGKHCLLPEPGNTEAHPPVFARVFHLTSCKNVQDKMELLDRPGRNWYSYVLALN